MSKVEPIQSDEPIALRRALSLRDLLIFGIVIVQPSAPLPIFGVIGQEARGHVVLTILIAMVAMLFTAVSYGRMAVAYPMTGSAYTYVGREIHPLLGQLTGWVMALDYIMNPLISIIWCSLATKNILPAAPFSVCAVFFAALFTWLNLHSVQKSAAFNRKLVAWMALVISIFFIASLHYLLRQPSASINLTRPFYDPATFALPSILGGASIAALTYIGFDGVSTLSEEAKNPRRNILLATVLTCVITGCLSGLEVYFGQLVWPEYDQFPNIETAFSYVAGRAGGPWLFHLVNLTLLIGTIGAGTAAQLGAARLLYAMGRENVLPKRFFGVLEGERRIPRNNVLLVGGIALFGAFTLNYQLAAEKLNFGAFIAFMGVNISSAMHYYFRADKRRLANFLFPFFGFMLCFYLWVNLSDQAKVWGFIWLACGAIYRLIRWRMLHDQVKAFEPEISNRKN